MPSLSPVLRWSRRLFIYNVYDFRHLHYTCSRGTSRCSAWDKSESCTNVDMPNGTSIQLSCGNLAKFADGSAVARYGDTSVMVTAVSKGRASPSNFLPLTVDFRQKAAAAGRIPTNYKRRELGPTDHEILTSRMIDRSIRPLFPAGYSADTQIVCNMLAVDGVNDPNVLSINAASTALAISDIPWGGPIGAVRVGLLNGEILLNPSRLQRKKSTLDLVVASSEAGKVFMIEASAENVSPGVFVECLKRGVENASFIAENINKFSKEQGKEKRALADESPIPKEIVNYIEGKCKDSIIKIFTDSTHHKFSRDNAIQEVKEVALKEIEEVLPFCDKTLATDSFNNLTKTIFRELVFKKNTRCDGRLLTDLRPITCMADLYEPLHGSALFQRGQTQVLSTITFDSPESAAKVDAISALVGGIKEKNFFLHYEFPPFAVNETGRPGMISRRELGHGALAEKALRPVIPSDFPFTIRLTAEVLESNGSSSMATACAGSLALMDAGVPISEPVSGIAIGLLTKLDRNGELSDYRILTDLLGIEDYLGDMDFKLAGTANGISALQADIKINGLSLDIVQEAIDRAMDGNKKILGIMAQCREEPRPQRKECGPVLEKLEVQPHQRAQFLGVGGYNLKKLLVDTGVSITPLEGTLFQVFAPNKDAMSEAKERIEDLLKDSREKELEFGAIYKAKIVEIRDIGVMVKLYDNMSPSLVHNSQLDNRKIRHPSALGLDVGQEIDVKYFGRDPASGQMRLSRKVIFTPAIGTVRKLGEIPDLDSS